ncbi:HAD-IA family hydrolase [Coleofasciculus sp. FACHB-1120]|uniref:HAD-IA family hydrolase n=1 Tax=Coleofasciculus sp. FACHB-1120 TaxID=2692783 RepID=UPI001682128D|nr:HAD-IA family hydrolase [Coleofasciculus sp. FACHB-1120]MBD2740203.1 HAD-IA family hydrolase [Coleofasciculus sp. FACHB-1120]
MTAKVIIFDFDGTIADSLDAVVNITNRLAVEFGYQPANLEDIEKIKSLSSREIIQFSGVSIFKLPFLLRKVRVRLNNQIRDLKPFPGIKETFTELKSQGNQLGIITSNSKENVTIFLKENDFIGLFDFIYSAPTIFGKHKVINSFSKKQNIQASEMVYVGDETRDIEAARKSRIKVISVSWGFNSKEVLAKHQPDFLVNKPSELLKVIKSLQEQVL